VKADRVYLINSNLLQRYVVRHTVQLNNVLYLEMMNVTNALHFLLGEISTRIRLFTFFWYIFLHMASNFYTMLDDLLYNVFSVIIFVFKYFCQNKTRV
jgi:hypothetical protein